MKNIVSFLLICAACAGCQGRRHQNEVVKEVYLHKYGVPVPKTDWVDQGQEGQVVQLHTDGVHVTRTYVQGVLNGETTYSFPNSSVIHHVEMYVAGEVVSRKENYPSGVPMHEELFEENAVVQVTRWYEDGTPQAVEAYSAGALITGEYRTLLNAVESSFQEGHGMRICRSGTGELLSKDTIHNGQMVERTTYFASGDPATVTPFNEGRIHGVRLTFLQGGVPYTKEEWAHGVQEGITSIYQNGEKAAEILYVKGKKEGVEKRYREGSVLAEEVSWHENIQHGEHRLFVDGSVTSQWFHHGELVSRPTFERMNVPRS